MVAIFFSLAQMHRDLASLVWTFETLPFPPNAITRALLSSRIASPVYAAPWQYHAIDIHIVYRKPVEMVRDLVDRCLSATRFPFLV